jgi:hypothetical protein
MTVVKFFPCQYTFIRTVDIIKGVFVVWTNTLSPGTSYPILYTLNNDLPNFTKYVSNNILGAGVPKRHGCAVRCVKD